MTTPRRDCALAVSVTLVVIGVSLNTGWTRAFHSQIHALAETIADDSFYYLLPAWRFKTTHFFTFDGLHQTYGFQPLWELVLVLAAYATPDKETFLRVALFLPHVLRAGTAAVRRARLNGLDPRWLRLEESKYPLSGFLRREA